MKEQIQELVSFYEEKLTNYKRNGKRVMASSSFQTHSIPMLKILSECDHTIPIYFLNTGYHFPETIEYKNKIANLYGLNVVELNSPIPKSQQTTTNGQLMFAQHPDSCCHMNKTLPMDPILASHDVWITGVRRDQNENRRNMDFEAKGKYGITRFHPMLDWTQSHIDFYLKEYNIPKHPLEGKGYFSIGCEPCTQKPSGSMSLSSRGGRWAGMKKTECGLHTDLIEK
ncbi:MAG: phosphoadenylyl-sulfate reductase [Bacteroidia bacterium]